MRAILVVLALALLAGCTSSSPAATPSAAPSAAPSPSPASPSAAPAPSPQPLPEPAIPEAPPTLTGPLAFTASLSSLGITPERMDAVPGMAVTWKNVDPAATHSIVSDDGSFVGSGPIAPGGEFTFIFSHAGDFAYHCRYHPDMTGIVIVR